MNLRIALLLPVFLAAGARAFGQTPAAPPVEAPVSPPGSVVPGPALHPGEAPHEHFDADVGPAHDEPTRFWGQAEYLLMWIKGDPVPPLVTSSPAGTPMTSAGVLGAASTI